MSWVFFREQNPICHGNKNKKLRNSRYVISTFPQEGNYIIMEKLFVYNILMSNSMIPNDDVQLKKQGVPRKWTTDRLSKTHQSCPPFAISVPFVVILSILSLCSPIKQIFCGSLEMKEILRVSLKLIKNIEGFSWLLVNGLFKCFISMCI